MVNPHKLLGTFASLGLLLGTATTAATMEMPAEPIPRGAFQRIEQPLSTKAVVVAGGLTLIGLELWWFLLSKPKAQRTALEQGVQKVTIQVDGGYQPNQVVVKAGQPVQLDFFRKDPNSCLEQVLIPDFQISADLPLNQVTSVTFTPQKPGMYPFTCGMNMFRGVIQTEA